MLGITGDESEKEGKVNDLVEKLERGEITSKDALKELKKRGLLEPETWEIIPWVAYFALWLLPFVSSQLKLDFLAFFAQLPSISFPSIVIYVMFVPLVIGTVFLVWAAHSHYTRGGLKKVDETIFLYKEGPYRIMRHPGAFGGLMWPVLLPIVLSAYIPFTLLSVGAMLTMIIYAYLGLYLEEKLDIEKWGSEYQQYMKEVPKINFILGIWRLRLQKKG